METAEAYEASYESRSTRGDASVARWSWVRSTLDLKAERSLQDV